MTEKLLQYIWQFQYFNKSSLQTSAGEKIEIIHQGKWNTDQGPDFTGAQIRIGDLTMAGSVELHIKTSQWTEHRHSDDPNYNNVILHVVYENNDAQGPAIPVLELQPRISGLLLDKYWSLMNSPNFIACAGSVSEVREIVWQSWKERVLSERLTRKSATVFRFLETNQGHWEEACWWLLARNFGMKTNGEAFEAIARSVSLNLLAKHKSSIHQLEALLLGQSGLLQKKFNDDYPKLLQREYRFLRKKYSLTPINHPVHFLRMRPVNFPTVRLAQLAALVHQSAHLFSRILETESIVEMKNIFDVQANDYWHYHYRMDELSSFKIKRVGSDMIDNLVVNTIVPLLFAYGLFHKDESFKTRALNWLELIDAESNKITKGFTALKVSNRSAFDSQALIELKTQYCDAKYCLKCGIGNSLLKTGYNTDFAFL